DYYCQVYDRSFNVFF
nr:immunoglobulin light chain junction region [Macaca mulatta]MOX33098.1 immunoglobulin light chain junction region [Macaca mulatta]